MHDQLKVSRQLTEQKDYDPDSEDDENVEAVADEEFSLLKASSENADNPWLLGRDAASSIGFCNKFYLFTNNVCSMACEFSLSKACLKIDSV